MGRRDVSSADLVIKNHQSIRAELEARADSFDACVAMGTALLHKGHYAAEKVPPAPHPPPHIPCPTSVLIPSSPSHLSSYPHTPILPYPHIPISP